MFSEYLIFTLFIRVTKFQNYSLSEIMTSDLDKTFSRNTEDTSFLLAFTVTPELAFVDEHGHNKK